MKKTVLTILIIFFNIFYSNSQSSSEGWIKELNSSYAVTPLYEDNEGNLFTCGIFNSPSITIDGITLTTDEDTSAIFMLKSDEQGNTIWAKKIASSPTYLSVMLKSDGEGNFYIYGNFNSQISFENTTLTSSLPVVNMFLAKLDSEGNLVWAKKAEVNCLNCSITGRDIMITPDNNIILTGSFDSDSVNFGSNIINVTGGNNVYIVKYDSNGNDLWVKTNKGDAEMSNIALLAAADNGNFYITGTFSGNAYNIENINLISNGGIDVYFAKYNTQGNVLWAKSFGSTGFDSIQSIEIDSLGNIILLGYYSNTFSIGDNIILSPNGNGDVVIGKFSNTGDVIWAKTIGTSLGEIGYELSTDSNNNIYISGAYSSPITLGNTTLTNEGIYNTFFTKLDSSGNFIDAKGIYSSGVAGAIIERYPSGNIFMKGIFQSDITINEETLTINNGDYGYFYGKLNSNILGTHTFNLVEKTFIYPNPVKNILNISGNLDPNLSFTITDITGRIMKQGLASDKSTEVSYFPSGLYIFKADNGINTKFIKE